MPLFDLTSRKPATDVPFKPTFDLMKRRITQAEFDAIERHLDSMIDGDEIHTAGWMPGANWSGTPFDPIYQKAARRNEELAARMFGLFVWYVFMRRPERWISGRFEKDGEPIGSRTYFRDKSDL